MFSKFNLQDLISKIVFFNTFLSEITNILVIIRNTFLNLLNSFKGMNIEFALCMDKADKDNIRLRGKLIDPKDGYIKNFENITELENFYNNVRFSIQSSAARLKYIDKKIIKIIKKVLILANKRRSNSEGSIVKNIRNGVPVGWRASITINIDSHTSKLIRKQFTAKTQK